MKKILTAIVLFAFVVLPMSAMAMTSIADNELSTVTGQAGVSINVDITAHVQVGTLAWGDSDGITQAMGTIPAGTFGNMGFVGVGAMDLTLTIAGRTDGPFASGSSIGVGYLLNKPITIDVGTSAAGQTLVRIGLPTLHVTVSALDMNIFVSGGALATGPTSTTAQSLGSVYISGIDIKLGQSATPAVASSYDAGYVTIGAAGAADGTNKGVNIGFLAKIDSVELGTVSYGNTTSLLAGTAVNAGASGGYIGLSSLVLDNITVGGGVAIGIGTLDGNNLGAGAFGIHTMVNIVIADGTFINIPGAIYGSILLAQDKQLTTGVETLGNFYIGGVTATVLDNVAWGGGATATNFSPHSMIQIWAH